MKWQSLLQFFLLTTFITTFNTITSASGDSPQVIVKDFKFVPQEITIKRGQTINWENREKRQYHSVWFEALGEEEPDYIFPDETYQREFKETGTFPYRCGPHPRMTGTVHVTE
jgi:plastocyanin